MAIYGEYETIPGLVATGDLSAKQYYIVIAASTAGAVKIGSTAATDPLLGVLQNDPTSGQAAEIAFSGICKAAAEATVAYGDELTISSTGRCVTTTTDGDRIVGIALRANTTAGYVIPVMLSLHDRYKL